MVSTPEPCGVHVPDHSPLPIAISGRDGSPDEKLATTVPVSMGSPHESRIETSSGVGKPTVDWNPTGSEMNPPNTSMSAHAAKVVAGFTVRSLAFTPGGGPVPAAPG